VYTDDGIYSCKFLYMKTTEFVVKLKQKWL